MKMKSILALVVGLATVFSATAQKAENDDMYFTSKDRAKAKPTVTANTRVQVERSAEVAPKQEAEAGINPTDSYSARNVNPEYSTGTTQTSPKSSGDYFVENYRPTGVNGNLNGDYSSTSTPGMYNSAAAMGASNYGMGYSPYSRYGYAGYSPYMGMGMGMSPYYGSGMSMSMMYRYGYGSAFGYNPYMYGSPYGYGGMYGSMYDPFYDPFSYGMGMGMGMSCLYSFYGYNNIGYYGSPYGYQNGYVDNNTINGRQIAYGRRADRSTSTDYQPDGNNRDAATQMTRTGRPIATSNGRTRADNTQPYYERGWRSNLNGDNTATRRSVWSNLNSGTNPGNTNSGMTNWNNSGNNSGRTSGTSSWGSFENGSSSGSSRSSWTPSVGGGGGGGSRSSSSGGGGGGGSRGRD